MRPSCTLRRTRTAHLTLATLTAAAVLAAALALSAGGAAGQTVASPLHLHLGRRHLHFGRAVRVSGAAPAGDAGRFIVVQMQPRGSAQWSQAGATTVGAGGGFAVRIAPRLSGAVRAVELPAGAGSMTVDAAPATGPAPTVASAAQPLTVSARFAVRRRHLSVLAGGRVRVSGRLLPAQPGRVVRLQGRTGRGWRTLGRTRTGRRGGFSVRYRPASPQHLRVLFSGDARNGRVLGDAGSVLVFRADQASWYNDGGMTACGFHAGLGVANRTLPCGTRVTFMYGGRKVTATVDDRGPYVGGRNWDLNQSTAAALGFGGVGTVWVSG